MAARVFRMRSTKNFRKKRSLSVLIAGLAATSVLTVAPTSVSASVTPSGVSTFAEDPATPDIDVQAGSHWGPNAPMGRLQINGVHALVTRTPSATATEAEVATWNATAPKLTCKTNVTTNAAEDVAANGTYALESGQLVIRFTFDFSVGLESDACTLTNSDFVEKATNITWGITNAGLAAVYGAPTTLEAAAKAILDSTVPAVATTYAKTKKFATPPTLVKQLRKALPTVKFAIAFGGEDMENAGTVYVLRKGWKPHSLRLGTRSADGNMVVLTYSARPKTSKYMTYPLEVMERVAEPSVTTQSVRANGITTFRNAKYLPGAATPLQPIVVSGFEDASKAVLMSLSTSKGKIRAIPNGTVTPLFGYGTSGQPMIGSQLLFIGLQTHVNTTLKSLMLELDRKEADGKAYTGDVVIKAMATEYLQGMTYSPTTEHFYKYVAFDPAVDSSFPQAQSAAEASRQLGLKGYLATVTTAAENEFVSRKIALPDAKSLQVVQNVFIGGSDSTTEGDWKWVGGPEKETSFWSGCDTVNGGKAVSGAFSSWAKAEPNNWISNTNYCGGTAYNPATPGGENCLVTNRLNKGDDISKMIPGAWNDFPCYNTKTNGVLGYIVEYGDKAIGGIESPSVFLTSTTLVAPPAPKVASIANVIQRLTTFIGKITKKLTPARIVKQKPRPATVTHTFKAKLNLAGAYSLTIKQVDGKGVPFAFQPGTKYSAPNRQKVSITGERWNLIVQTRNDNETISVTSVIKNFENLKMKNLKLNVRLLWSYAEEAAQMCMANWCQPTKPTVDRVVRSKNADGSMSVVTVSASAPIRAKVDAAGPKLP